MHRLIVIMIVVVSFFASCRSTKNIQTAIAKKDSVATVLVADTGHEDTINFIKETLKILQNQKIEFTTFSAKVNIDYTGGDDKKYNVNANLRMYRDSVIWVSVNAIFGIEAMRVYITKDSVKLLDKQNKIFTSRSLAYLQDITALPLDLYSLQDLIVGNPVFLDSNIVSYSRASNSISLLSIGDWFKNLVTLSDNAGMIHHSKLDDIDVIRNRTCDLTYSGYENKKGVLFSTNRKITVAEKSKLDVKLDFKQYEFNETLSFPFNIPKNYSSN